VLQKILITTLFCLIVGTAIEAIQLLIQRDFSTDDIINNLIGGYLGLLCLVIFDRQKNNKSRIIAFLFAGIFCIIGLRDLEKHLIDELAMRQSFPIIADFESRLELDRWDKKLVRVKRVQQHAVSGTHSLKVDFLLGKYPSISLQHLNNDWSQHSQLVFHVYNPSQESITVQMKIYDAQHAKRIKKYYDRFNKGITITPGWNTIKTVLTDIARAPKHRTINLEQIKSFSLFIDNPDKALTLYLDHIHLQ